MDIRAGLAKYGIVFNETRGTQVNMASAERLLRVKQLQAMNPGMSERDASRAVAEFPTAASFNVTRGTVLTGLGIAQRAWELQFCEGGGKRSYAEASRMARDEFAATGRDGDKPLAQNFGELMGARARK